MWDLFDGVSFVADLIFGFIIPEQWRSERMALGLVIIFVLLVLALIAWTWK